jgi:hypothetical protein
MDHREARTSVLNKTAKLDATTVAAYEIIDNQAHDREKKTARLKALRLAKGADMSTATPLPKRSRST